MKEKQESYLKRKFIKPLLGFLKQGVSPEKLSLTVAFGAIWGTFPILGTNTIICIGTAMAFRLNHAAIQLVNYAMYPIQLALIIPFIKLGIWITGQNALNYTFDEIWEIMKADQWRAFQTLGEILWAGLLGWLIFAVPLFLLLRFLLTPVFKRLVKEQL